MSKSENNTGWEIFNKLFTAARDQRKHKQATENLEKVASELSQEKTTPPNILDIIPPLTESDMEK